MFRSIRKYTPLFRRIFVFLFIFVFSFLVIARPIQVSASATATIAIGAYGAVKLVIGAKALIGLIVGTITGSLLVPLLDTTDKWYDEDPVIREWADLYGNSFSLGGIVPVPIDVQASIREKFPLLDPALDLSKLYIPYDLTRLDSLSTSHIFDIDVAEQLKNNNALIVESNSIMNSIAGSFSSGIADIKQIVSSSYSDMIYHLNVINNNAMSRLQTLKEYINDMSDYLGWRIDNVAEVLTNTRTMLNTAINDFREQFGSQINYISQIMLNTRIELNDSVVAMKNTLNNRIIEVKNAIQDLPKSISNSLSTRFDSLEKTMNDILVEVRTLTKPEVVAKPEIQVQAGTQTIVVSDYASMGQAFSAKMGWIPDIFNFLRELFQRIVNPPEPPKIPLRLSLAEGSIDWGEDTYFIDMSWYARYKPFVDTIISGILWLVFGWNVYKKVPDILAGVGLSQEPVSSTPLPLTPSSSDQKLLTSRKLLKGGNRDD